MMKHEPRLAPYGKNAKTFGNKSECMTDVGVVLNHLGSKMAVYKTEFADFQLHNILTLHIVLLNRNVFLLTSSRLSAFTTLEKNVLHSMWALPFLSNNIYVFQSTEFQPKLPTSISGPLGTANWVIVLPNTSPQHELMSLQPDIFVPVQHFIILTRSQDEERCIHQDYRMKIKTENWKASDLIELEYNYEKWTGYLEPNQNLWCKVINLKYNSGCRIMTFYIENEKRIYLMKVSFRLFDSILQYNVKQNWKSLVRISLLQWWAG